MSLGTIRHNIVTVLLCSKLIVANRLVNHDGDGSLLAEKVCNKRTPKNEKRRLLSKSLEIGRHGYRDLRFWFSTKPLLK